MNFLLKNESFENKLSLLSLLEKSKEDVKALHIIDEFAILKCFPEKLDYDIVRSLGMLENLIKSDKSKLQNIYNLSYFMQRLVNICSDIPNGKTILTSILGKLIERKTFRYSTPFNGIEIVHSKDNNYVHFAAVSFLALNKLRDITDAFPAVYAVFRCSDIIDSNNYCTHVSGSNYTYMMAERIVGETVDVFLNAHTNLSILILLGQIVGALQIAYTTKGYKHNNLTPDKIYAVFTADSKNKYFSRNYNILSGFTIKIVSDENASLHSLGEKNPREELSDVKNLLSKLKSLKFYKKENILLTAPSAIERKYFNELFAVLSSLETFEQVLTEIRKSINDINKTNYDLFKFIINPKNVIKPLTEILEPKDIETYTNSMHYLLYASYIDKLNYSLIEKIPIQPFEGILSKEYFTLSSAAKNSLPNLLKVQALFAVLDFSGNKESYKDERKVLNEKLNEYINISEKTVQSGSLIKSSQKEQFQQQEAPQQQSEYASVPGGHEEKNIDFENIEQEISSINTIMNFFKNNEGSISDTITDLNSRFELITAKKLYYIKIGLFKRNLINSFKEYAKTLGELRSYTEIVTKYNEAIDAIAFKNKSFEIFQIDLTVKSGKLTEQDKKIAYAIVGKIIKLSDIPTSTSPDIINKITPFIKKFSIKHKYLTNQDSDSNDDSLKAILAFNTLLRQKLDRQAYTLSEEKTSLPAAYSDYDEGTFFRLFIHIYNNAVISYFFKLKRSMIRYYKLGFNNA